MSRIGRELATVDTTRLAVLAALNIADELYRARLDTTGATTRLLARAADIERIVDAALETGDASPVAGSRAAR